MKSAADATPAPGVPNPADKTTEVADPIVEEPTGNAATPTAPDNDSPSRNSCTPGVPPSASIDKPNTESGSVISTLGFGDKL